MQSEPPSGHTHPCITKIRVSSRLGASEGRSRSLGKRSSEVALVRSLLVISICLFVLYLPFAITVLLTFFLKDDVPPELPVTSTLLLLVNCAVNWIIYGVMNTAYRHAYVTTLRKCVCCERLRRARWDTSWSLHPSPPLRWSLVLSESLSVCWTARFHRLLLQAWHTTVIIRACSRVTLWFHVVVKGHLTLTISNSLVRDNTAFLTPEAVFLIPGDACRRGRGRVGGKAGTSSSQTFHLLRSGTICIQTNIGTASVATIGRLLGDGAERLWAFPSVKMLSWAENSSLRLGPFGSLWTDCAARERRKNALLSCCSAIQRSYIRWQASLTRHQSRSSQWFHLEVRTYLMYVKTLYMGVFQRLLKHVAGEPTGAGLHRLTCGLYRSQRPNHLFKQTLAESNLPQGEAKMTRSRRCSTAMPFKGRAPDYFQLRRLVHDMHTKLHSYRPCSTTYVHGHHTGASSVIAGCNAWDRNAQRVGVTSL